MPVRQRDFITFVIEKGLALTLVCLSPAAMPMGCVCAVCGLCLWGPARRPDFIEKIAKEEPPTEIFRACGAYTLLATFSDIG